MPGLTSPYASGEYLERNPTWHVEESPWKARQILRLLARNQLTPRTICEVGCGAGEVLRRLQAGMADDCHFWGYDISPSLLPFWQDRVNGRLHLELKDLTRETDRSFDLVLVLDVIEHLEDYFAFLRAIKPRGQYTVLHIPLELSAQTVVRRGALSGSRDAYGHLHFFTKETALRALEDTGYGVIDYVYTPRAIDIPTSVLSRRLLKMPRRLLFTLNQDVAVRVLGGYSLLVVAH